MHRVHHFTSTRLAYDACFDDPHVREGDVLVIAREQIVGLASSDPIAVTTGHGYLRTIPAMSRDTLSAYALSALKAAAGGQVTQVRSVVLRFTPDK